MQVFLSHSADDAAIAHTVKTLIERCSLGKVSVWFSSDTSGSGGMTPGGPWFEQLVSRISSSSVFVALLTPRSFQNLWLHYEMGCAAIKAVPIMPLALGVSMNDVGLPISLYNTHFLSRPADLKNFLMKLFAIQDIPHDAEMLEAPVQRATDEILRLQNERRETSQSVPGDGYDRVLRLMDQRFMDLIDALPNERQKPSKKPSFSVPVRVLKYGQLIDQFVIDVDDHATLQDVADNCYFKIERHVGVYSYLVEWIIRDKTLNAYLVVLDIAPYLKANHVIRPGHEYELHILSKPFDPRAFRKQQTGIDD